MNEYPNAAEMQGITAFGAGDPKYMNPYAEWSPRHHDWNMGWESALMDHLLNDSPSTDSGEE